MDPFHGRPTWAEVDLAQLRRNLAILKAEVRGDTEVMAVVKANAYGHGAVAAARAFVQAGATRLAVAALGEALELRAAGITVPILVLGWTPPREAAPAIDYGVRLTLYSMDEAKELSALATLLGKPLYYHLKVDTGMGRIGVRPRDGDALDVAEHMAKLPGLVMEGCYTHFADADSEAPAYTLEQLSHFRQFVQALERRGVQITLKHAANSAALVNFPESHFDIVRPGITQYGYYPSPFVRRLPGIAPALQFKTRVAHVKRVSEGDSISYNCTYTASESRWVATLPVGYADGFSRRHSNGGVVLVEGRRCPVVGRVCMDQTMVDVTGVPGVGVGSQVVLIGRQGNEVITADDRAEELGTISHEVLCAIARRVPRVYVESQ